MAELISTKPYLLRAIHEWCVDNQLTPYLLVSVTNKTRVPMAYVKNGEIVLNLSDSASKNLLMDNDAIVFSARFGGVSHNLYIPIQAVKGIFSRENGQGMFFEPEAEETEPATPETTEIPENEIKPKKPALTVVK